MSFPSAKSQVLDVKLVRKKNSKQKNQDKFKPTKAKRQDKGSKMTIRISVLEPT